MTALSGMDLHLQGSGKDLAEIGTITGKKLSASDTFTVHGWLMGYAKALSLLEADGSASRGSLYQTFNGEIKELMALEGIDVKPEASGKELAEIGPLLGTGLPELGSFDVSGKLSGSAKTISLNDFSAIVDKSDFNGQVKVEFLQRPPSLPCFYSNTTKFNNLPLYWIILELELGPLFYQCFRGYRIFDNSYSLLPICWLDTYPPKVGLK